MTTVYTVGHSNHSMERFLALLRRHDVERLVDVRSHPYSRFMPHFRRRPLRRTLEAAGVAYVFLGDALGGRPEGEAFHDADGRVDYARRALAPDFRAGIAHLVNLASAQRTVVLCAEEDPMRCHRRGLVAPALRECGVDVVHIRGDGCLQAERDDAGPDGQLGLFS